MSSPEIPARSLPAGKKKRGRPPVKNRKYILVKKKTKGTKTGKPLFQLQAEATTASIPTTPFVTDDKKPLASHFVHRLLTYMRPCVFTSADYISCNLRAKHHQPGMMGFCCQFCIFSQTGNFRTKGRFFPSNFREFTKGGLPRLVETSYNHMMKRWDCPLNVCEELTALLETHETEWKMMKYGTRSAFAALIWRRLHETSSNDEEPLASTGVILDPTIIEEVQDEEPLFHSTIGSLPSAQQ